MKKIIISLCLITSALYFPLQAYSVYYTRPNVNIKFVDSNTTAEQYLQKALANKHTKTSNKLFELINKDNLKESYNSIKKFLPKARARSAAAGAVALGTLTTLVTIFFNPSTQNN